MKTPDKPDSPGIQEIEAHIASCPDCSAEAQALDEMIDNLEHHKDAFCPEPWQLSQFVDTEEESPEQIAVHLESCAKCRETVAEYKKALSEDRPMPVPVMQAFRNYHAKGNSPSVSVAAFRDSPSTDYPMPGPAPEARRDYSVEKMGQSGSAPASKNLLSRIMVSISSIFTIPTMALGTVAAAILVVVIVYPRGDGLSPIGLSAVTWESKLTLLGPTESQTITKGMSDLGAEKKPTIAFIISFRGFKEPMPQQRVDKLYEALKPTKEIEQKYEVLTPAKVKDALGSEQPPADKKQLSKQLSTDLGLSQVLLITVEQKDNKIGIDNQLINVQTGDTIVKTSRGDVTESDLAARLKDSVFSLLTR